jgi:hypothetical protein
VLQAIANGKIRVEAATVRRVKAVERLGDAAPRAERRLVASVFARIPSRNLGPTPHMALARRLVQDTAARVAFRTIAAEGRRAPPRAPAPRGMGRATGLFSTENNAVSMAPIPMKRAVKVNKQWWNAKTLRTLLKHNPRASNPLTRQPLPAKIIKKYSTVDQRSPNMTESDVLRAVNTVHYVLADGVYGQPYTTDLDNGITLQVFALPDDARDTTIRLYMTIHTQNFTNAYDDAQGVVALVVDNGRVSSVHAEVRDANLRDFVLSMSRLMATVTSSFLRLAVQFTGSR